jgi:hypothetical protein
LPHVCFALPCPGRLHYSERISYRKPAHLGDESGAPWPRARFCNVNGRDSCPASPMANLHIPAPVHIFSVRDRTTARILAPVMDRKPITIPAASRTPSPPPGISCPRRSPSPRMGHAPRRYHRDALCRAQPSRLLDTFIISTVHSIPLGLAEPILRTRSDASGTSEGRAAIRRPDDEATMANIGATDGQRLFATRVRTEGHNAGRQMETGWESQVNRILR